MKFKKIIILYLENIHIPVYVYVFIPLRFFPAGSSKDLCRPLMVKNTHCGIVPFPVLDALQNYQDTFPFVKDDKTGNIKFVTINDQYRTAEQRSLAVDHVVKEFRDKNMFATLNGWRDEVIC